MRTALLTVLLLAACSRGAAPAPARARPPLPASLIPSEGILFGAYMDFGETEDDVTPRKIGNFESLLGKSPAIIASSSYWGKQSFPAENLRLIASHGAVPLVFWSPWDKPYDQNHGPDRFGLREILAGKWDAYIDRWADGAKAFGKPVLVSLCNEMNGSWFPWSGYFYGRGKPVPGQPGKFESSEIFKNAWRHVVDRARARGASNIRWVLHFNNYPYPNDTWNEMAKYYPGADYVDWLGLSVYGKQTQNDPWVRPEELLDYPYREICALAPDKPVMVTEFGVGEFPKSGDKARWIAEMFESIKKRSPRIRAAIYWHERWQNEDQTYSNLRINSSAPVLQAFRKALADPVWITNGEP